MEDNSLKNRGGAAVTVDFRGNDELKRNGISLHWWSADTTDLHNHNFYEFFIITKGSVFHEINGETSVLKTGMLYFIRPEDCHRISSLAEQSCSRIVRATF